MHGWLKVGRKHSGRFWARLFGRDEALAVADAENSENGSEESVRQSCFVVALPGAASSSSEETA